MKDHLGVRIAGKGGRETLQWGVRKPSAVCVLFNGCANGFMVLLYVNTYQTICLNICNLLYVNNDAINDKKSVIASRCGGFVFNPSTHKL